MNPPEPFARGPDGRSTDLPSGRGVPDWIAASLNFCSRCGAPLSFGAVPGEDRDRLACAACGHIVYVNPRLVVTTFPITDAGEIVLIRRGIEPGKGSWAQPGGFLEIDETVHQAAIRETWEETRLLVEPGEPRRWDLASADSDLVEGPDRARVARGRGVGREVAR